MSNVTDALKLRHQEDVATILLLSEGTPGCELLEYLSKRDVEHLWDCYSSSMCAGWLIIDPSTFQGFVDWLNS